MKIALPVDEKRMDTNVCISFGRAPYFLIYDTDTQESVFLDNSAAASTGGAGIKAAGLVADNGVEVLLTPRCGQNAAKIIETAGIKMYKTRRDSAEENIQAYLAGKLHPLDEVHAGFHHHGGR